MREQLTMIVESPLGPLTLRSDGAALTRLTFGVGDGPRGSDAVLLLARAQLAEYFEAGRRAFDVQLGPKGTELQLRIWRALGDIPFGETASYADVARRIGRPRAARAVGAANGKNPIAIIVPCHRVIGSDGSLVGYAGGTNHKAWLLRHERARSVASMASKSAGGGSSSETLAPVLG